MSETQRVSDVLRQMILIGEIAPGERLKVEELKSRLGAGATPIREALSLLTSDQLVERLEQRGFRAAAASRENFDEIFRLRCQLEVNALTESIKRGSEAWEENLLLAHHRLSKVPRQDTQRFEHLHKLFHMALLDACASPILLRYCSQLYDLNIRYRHLAGKTVNYGKRDVGAEHREILDAVIARDTDHAASALIDHYEQTGRLLSNQFN